MYKLLTILILLVITSPLKGEIKLVFSSGEEIISRISGEILVEGYREIGIEVKIQYYPVQRALLLSNKGLVDGEVNRVVGIEKKYENLLRVPIPVNFVEAVVFTKKLDFHISDWASLSPYKIGIRRGIKFIEKETQGMMRYFTQDNAQLLSLLNTGRVDLVVTSRLAGMSSIKMMDLKNIKILEPPLVKKELYHYLHKKRIDLIPKITAILRKKQAENKIQEIREKIILKKLK